MDVWNEQTIDIGLKVVGYLAAALFGVLVHSANAGRRSKAASERLAESICIQPDSGTAAGSAAQVQFVDLRRQASRSAAEEYVTPRDGRRDRADIIRLARQMLKAGTPQEMIRRTLPISEAELALLQSTNTGR